MSWYEVAVDLIGSRSSKTEHFDGEFYALRCIVTTNLVELTCIDSKASNVIAQKFEQTWLSHYLRLTQIVHDNGGKFMGYVFTCLIRTL